MSGYPSHQVLVNPNDFIASPYGQTAVRRVHKKHAWVMGAIGLGTTVLVLSNSTNFITSLIVIPKDPRQTRLEIVQRRLKDLDDALSENTRFLDFTSHTRNPDGTPNCDNTGQAGKNISVGNGAVAVYCRGDGKAEYSFAGTTFIPEDLRKRPLTLLKMFNVGVNLVSSKVGPRPDPMNNGRTQFHKGTDISVLLALVPAPFDGKIIQASHDTECGNFIDIESNLPVLYKGKTYRLIHRGCHLNNFARGIRAGLKIKKGDIVAKSGNSGLRTTGYHYHGEYILLGPDEEVSSNSPRITPEEYLKAYTAWQRQAQLATAEETTSAKIIIKKAEDFVDNAQANYAHLAQLERNARDARDTASILSVSVDVVERWLDGNPNSSSHGTAWERLSSAGQRFLRAQISTNTRHPASFANTVILPLLHNTGSAVLDVASSFDTNKAHLTSLSSSSNGGISYQWLDKETLTGGGVISLLSLAVFAGYKWNQLSQMRAPLPQQPNEISATMHQTFQGPMILTEKEEALGSLPWNLPTTPNRRGLTKLTPVDIAAPAQPPSLHPTNITYSGGPVRMGTGSPYQLGTLRTKVQQIIVAPNQINWPAPMLPVGSTRKERLAQLRSVNT